MESALKWPRTLGPGPSAPGMDARVLEALKQGFETLPGLVTVALSS